MKDVHGAWFLVETTGKDILPTTTIADRLFTDDFFPVCSLDVGLRFFAHTTQSGTGVVGT